MEAVILEESPMEFQSNINIVQVIPFPMRLSFSKDQDRGNKSHVNRIKQARGTHSTDKRGKTFYHMRCSSAVLEENHNKPIQETFEEEQMRRELEEHVTNRQRAYFHQSVMPSHKQMKGSRTKKAQKDYHNHAQLSIKSLMEANAIEDIHHSLPLSIRSSAALPIPQRQVVLS